MSVLNFALAHSELGISHFTTDLILVLSFAIVTALPMSLLRPQIQEDNVKSNVFKSWEEKTHLKLVLITLSINSVIYLKSI